MAATRIVEWISNDELEPVRIWLVEALKEASPETYQFAEMHGLLGYNVTATLTWLRQRTQYLRGIDSEPDESLLVAVEQAKQMICGLPIRVYSPFPIGLDDRYWEADLNVFLEMSSPEFHGLLVNTGVLPDILRDLANISRDKICQLTAEHPDLAGSLLTIRSNMIDSAATINPASIPVLPFSSRPQTWADQCRAMLRRLHPTQYRFLSHEGRLEEFVALFVEAALGRWHKLHEIAASDDDIMQFKSKLADQVAQLALTLVWATPLPRPTLTTTTAYVDSTQLQSATTPRLPDFMIMATPMGGASVAAALLANHPDVGMVWESNVLRCFFDILRSDQLINADLATKGMSRLHERLANNNLNSPVGLRNGKHYLSGLLESYRQAQLMTGNAHVNLTHLANYADAIDMAELLREVAAGLTWRDFLGKVFASLIPMSARMARIVGDKTSGMLSHAETASRSLTVPTLCVVRHPVYSVVSLMRQSRNSRFETALEIAAAGYKTALSLADHPQFRMLRLEDMASNPALAMSQAATHLGLSSDWGNLSLETSGLPDYTGNQIEFDRIFNFFGLGQQEAKTLYTRFSEFILKFYPDMINAPNAESKNIYYPKMKAKRQTA